MRKILEIMKGIGFLDRKGPTSTRIATPAQNSPEFDKAGAGRTSRDDPAKPAQASDHPDPNRRAAGRKHRLPRQQDPGRILKKVKRLYASGERKRADELVSRYETCCRAGQETHDWGTLAKLKLTAHRFTSVLDLEKEARNQDIKASNDDLLNISIAAIDACIHLNQYNEALRIINDLESDFAENKKILVRKARVLASLGEYEDASKYAKELYFSGERNLFRLLRKIIMATRDVGLLNEILTIADEGDHDFSQNERAVLEADRMVLDGSNYEDVLAFLWENEDAFDLDTFVNLTARVAFRSGDTLTIRRISDKVVAEMERPDFDQYDIPIRFASQCVQTLHNTANVRPILDRLDQVDVFTNPQLELKWLRAKGMIQGHGKILADIDRLVSDNPENTNARVLQWNALLGLEMADALEKSKQSFRKIVLEGTFCEALIETGWKSWSADDLGILLRYALGHPDGRMQVRVFNSVYRVPISHDELARIIDDLEIPANQIQRPWMVHLQMKAENLALLKDSALKPTRFEIFETSRDLGKARMETALADYVDGVHTEPAQDPMAVWGAERIRDLNRIESRFDKPLLLTSESFAESALLANYIVDRIERKTPASLLRIGDGEGHFMRPEDEAAGKESGDIRSIQRTWWAKVGLAGDRGDRIISEFRDAVASADVLGTFPYWRLMAQTIRGQYGGTAGNGIEKSLRAFEQLDTKGRLLTSAHFHQDLDAWHLWTEIFAWAREVSWISCHDLGAFLQSEHGVKTRNSISIPAESVHASKFDLREGHSPATDDEKVILPDLHETICEQIDAKPGEVWLIAAGFLGKIYCDLVRQRGGIGIDIGSLADYWMGHDTRIYTSDPTTDTVLQSSLMDEPPYVLTKDETREIIGPAGVVKSCRTGRYNIGVDATQDDMPPKARKKLAIIGHPRCASGYMSRLAIRHGLEIGHERYGQDGISSWMFTVEDLNPPYPMRDRITPVNTTFDFLLLHVRDPKEAVPSVILENAIGKSFSFRRQHILRECGVDIAGYDTAMDRATASIVYWTEIGLRRNPDWIIPVEQAETRFPDVVKRTGTRVEAEVELDADLGTNFNSSEKKHKHGAKKPVLSASDWLGADKALLTRLEAQCRRFGYDLPWETDRAATSSDTMGTGNRSRVA